MVKADRVVFPSGAAPEFPFRGVAQLRAHGGTVRLRRSGRRPAPGAAGRAGTGRRTRADRRAVRPDGHGRARRRDDRADGMTDAIEPDRLRRRRATSAGSPIAPVLARGRGDRRRLAAGHRRRRGGSDRRRRAARPAAPARAARPRRRRRHGRPGRRHARRPLRRGGAVGLAGQRPAGSGLPAGAGLSRLGPRRRAAALRRRAVGQGAGVRTVDAGRRARVVRPGIARSPTPARSTTSPHRSPRASSRTSTSWPGGCPAPASSCRSTSRRCPPCWPGRCAPPAGSARWRRLPVAASVRCFGTWSTRWATGRRSRTAARPHRRSGCCGRRDSVALSVDFSLLGAAAAGLDPIGEAVEGGAVLVAGVVPATYAGSPSERSLRQWAEPLVGPWRRLGLPRTGLGEVVVDPDLRARRRHAGLGRAGDADVARTRAGVRRPTRGLVTTRDR